VEAESGPKGLPGGVQRGWQVVQEPHEHQQVWLQWAKARDVDWSRVLDGCAAPTRTSGFQRPEERPSTHIVLTGACTG